MQPGTPTTRANRKLRLKGEACMNKIRLPALRRVLPVSSLQRQQGKLGWIFLWAIGVPIPILLILYLLRGCT